MKDTIFIHSLFRSGSTYIYSKFKEDAGFDVFQEPIHEMVLHAAQNEDLDLLNNADSSSSVLRHPNLSGGYYSDLIQKGLPTLKKLSKSDVYDDYFSDDISDSLKEYVSDLTESENRVVIQECRLSCRIKSFKKVFSGKHVFLLREPWSQWFSYRVTDYFDRINVLLLSIKKDSLFYKGTGFSLKESSDFFKEYDQTINCPLDFKTSYKAFFTIWALSLHHAINEADIILDMDLLSKSKEYREQVISMLKGIGVESLSFDDCNIPNTGVSAKTALIIESLEKEVLKFLDEGEPGFSSCKIKPFISCKKIDEKNYKDIDLFLNEIDKAYESKIKIINSFKALEDEHLKLKDDAIRNEKIISDMRASYSWRLTFPLRYIKGKIISKAYSKDAV